MWTLSLGIPIATRSNKLLGNQARLVSELREFLTSVERRATCLHADHERLKLHENHQYISAAPLLAFDNMSLQIQSMNLE
jgi:hypothetical protein